MILYSCIINRGGMKRVAEDLLNRPALDGLQILIFSPEKPKSLSGRALWIRWSEEEAPCSQEAIDFYRRTLNKHFENSPKPSAIVGDFFTIPYLSQLGVPLIYDVHLLMRPLYQALDKTEHAKLDQLTVHPDWTLLQRDRFETLRLEYKAMDQASGFIVNSKTSLSDLKSYYADVVGEKPVFHLPLPRPKTIESAPFKFDEIPSMPNYVFGRFHPQKGLSQLLFRDWSEQPLFIRGAREDQITPDQKATLISRGIHFLPWTDQEDELRRDLERARFVLFPSVYEPWGLALQESLAMGAICVAHANRSGHEEQIETGVNGFLLDFSRDDLLNQLSEIKLTKEQVSNLRRSAQNSVHDRGAARLTALKSFLDHWGS